MGRVGPVGRVGQVKRVRGTEYFEYACHEGNYGLPGILGGARAEERAKITSTR